MAGHARKIGIHVVTVGDIDVSDDGELLVLTVIERARHGEVRQTLWLGGLPHHPDGVFVAAAATAVAGTHTHIADGGAGLTVPVAVHTSVRQVEATGGGQAQGGDQGVQGDAQDVGHVHDVLTLARRRWGSFLRVGREIRLAYAP